MAISKIIKFKKEIIYGIGTMTENPEQYEDKPTNYLLRFWIKYDGYWYLTKLLPELNEDKIFISKIKNNCYNKEQLEEYILAILSIIEKN